jgi:hypothetical protein
MNNNDQLVKEMYDLLSEITNRLKEMGTKPQLDMAKRIDATLRKVDES